MVVSTNYHITCESLFPQVKSHVILTVKLSSNILKRRSASGNVYKSSIVIGNKTDSKASEVDQSRNVHSVSVNALMVQAPESSLNSHPDVSAGGSSEAKTHNLNGVSNQLSAIHSSTVLGAITTDTIMVSNSMAPAQGANSSHNNTVPYAQYLREIEMHQGVTTTGTRMSTMTTTTNVLPTTRSPAATGQDPGNPSQPYSPELMYGLLQTINNQLASISINVQSLMETKAQFSQELQGFKFDLEDVQDSQLKQNQEMWICQDQVQILTDMVISYRGQIQELQDKFVQQEANSKKSELIVFGLAADQVECQTRVELAKSFFQHKLKLLEDDLPTIQIAYWKGKSKNRPMVIKLTNPVAKGKIFKNIANLKETKNKADKGYQVLDHLPDQLAEDKSRQQYLYSKNKSSSYYGI